LSIELPRNIIDSNPKNTDENYTVLQTVNMKMLMKQQKGPSKDMTIDFDQSTEEIESAGTEMISEFGSGGGATITTIMVAETILGIVLVGGKKMVLE
jgi:hypothetical protein